jgi:hypothetical protein
MHEAARLDAYIASPTGVLGAPTPQRKRQVQEIRNHHVVAAERGGPDLQVAIAVRHDADQPSHQLEQRAVAMMQRRKLDGGRSEDLCKSGCLCRVRHAIRVY